MAYNLNAELNSHRGIVSNRSNKHTHTETHTNRQSVLSDFSRLPNRIYADRMLFTFLKYSAEKCLLGQTREKKRTAEENSTSYIFRSFLFCFRSFVIIFFFFVSIIFSISRVLTYSFMVVCLYVRGSSFASLVDNNAHIHVQCSVFMMMMMTVPFYLFHLVLCSPCQFIVACSSRSFLLLVFQRLNNNEAKRKISSHV